MKKLVVPVQPLPGESLPGLVARAAERNGYHRAGMVLDIAGLSPLRAESIASRPVETASALAFTLGAGLDEITPLYQPALDKTYVDFSGTPVRSVLKEVNLRRVSPRALQLSPHHRAVWQIKPLSFDPVTKETLLDHCPVCNEPLGFVKTLGICFCDHCMEAGELNYGNRPSVDLRDFPQPLVVVNDIEALDFVTALIDPEHDTVPALGEGLDGLTRGELFELALAMGTAAELNAQGAVLEEKDLVTRRYGLLLPEALARAGRVMLSWPDGYLDLCAEAERGASARDGKFARRKELGALANLQNGPALSQKVKLVLRQAEDRYLSKSQSVTSMLRKGSLRQGSDWITMTEAMEQFTCSPKLLVRLKSHPQIRSRHLDDDPRAPVLFDAFQLHGILKEWMELTGECECAARLGVPIHTVQELTHRGYLRRVSGIAAELSSFGTCYSARELDRLILKLRKDDDLIDLVPGDCGPGFVPVSEVMLRYPAGWKPWSTLIEAMIWGMVEVRLHREPTKGLMSALSVRGADKVYYSLSQGLQRHSPPEGAVALTSAQLMLNITKYDQLTALLGKGHLVLDADGLLPVWQILSFSQEHILQGEIGARAGIKGPRVASWAKERGLEPVIDLEVTSGRVFHRVDVEPYLDLQPWNGKEKTYNPLPDELHPIWAKPRGSPSRLKVPGYPRKFINQKPDFDPNNGYYAQRKARAAKTAV